MAVNHLVLGSNPSAGAIFIYSPGAGLSSVTSVKEEAIFIYSPDAGLSSVTSVKEEAIFIYEKWRQNAGEADCFYNLHFLCQQKITKIPKGVVRHRQVCVSAARAARVPACPPEHQ